MEREIGFPIISRSHSGIGLTPQGEELMPAIRSFLKANARLENQITAISESKKQTIRIAAYASIAMQWMPEILYRFRRSCPDANVDLRMVDNALEPFELLEAGKTDVIFASRQDNFNCDWTPLYNEVMYAILPKGYKVSGDTFPLTEFKDDDFIMPYGRFDLEVNAALGKVGRKMDTTPAYVDDETVIRMVGRGLGISMMTELMIRGRTDDVICLPVSPKTIRELGIGLSPGRKNESINMLKECVLEFINDRKMNTK